MLTSRVLEQLAVAPSLQRRITRGEYHRMMDVGLLGEDSHVELIEGVLVRMTPQSTPHAMVISLLARALTRALPDSLIVRVQMPISIGRHSEPEPDLVVARLSEISSLKRHPRRPLLVVEASRGSLNIDRAVKRELYARARIPEYWIIDVDSRTVEVHRQPDAKPGKYRSIAVVGDEGTLSASAFSCPRLSVRMFLGRPTAN